MKVAQKERKIRGEKGKDLSGNYCWVKILIVLGFSFHFCNTGVIKYIIFRKVGRILEEEVYKGHVASAWHNTRGQK